jgi:hypothetical protein
MPYAHLKLLNIPEHLEPGDAVECTLDGAPLECEFVKYGSLPRFVSVRIYGLREVTSGALSAQASMFEPSSFVDDFIVNHAPGRSWHRTAGMSVEVER